MGPLGRMGDRPVSRGGIGDRPVLRGDMGDRPVSRDLARRPTMPWSETDEGQKILKFLLEVITHEKTSNDEKSEYYKDLLAENPDTPPYKHPIMDSVEWTPAAEADGSVKQADFEAFPPEEEKLRYEAFIKQFLNKPPDKGVLRFRYDRVPVVDLEKRKELSRQHLGWVGGLLSGEALKDHLGRMRNPNAAAATGR